MYSIKARSNTQVQNFANADKKGDLPGTYNEQFATDVNVDRKSVWFAGPVCTTI